MGIRFHYDGDALRGRECRYAVVETAWGWFGLMASGEVVRRTVLPGLGKGELEKVLRGYEEGARRDDDLLVGVQEQVRRYFAEGLEEWEAVVDLSWAGPFARRVYECCGKVKEGERVSYGELARRAGSARAARAVGQAMGRNRTALLIPCHRVCGSGGALVGFGGIGGVAAKERLLRWEEGRGR